MKIVKPASAGTLESSDIEIRIEPADEAGIEIHLTSSVMQQFGKKIEAVIKSTLEELGVDSAYVDAVDKGALDCTVRARTAAAAHRAAEDSNYEWRVKA
jgi:citrate lyase subunit gamma (acyl carrier protein)